MLAVATRTETTVTRRGAAGFRLGFLGAVPTVAPWNTAGNAVASAIAWLVAGRRRRRLLRLHAPPPHRPKGGPGRECG